MFCHKVKVNAGNPIIVIRFLHIKIRIAHARENVIYCAIKKNRACTGRKNQTYFLWILESEIEQAIVSKGLKYLGHTELAICIKKISVLEYFVNKICIDFVISLANEIFEL